MGKTGLGLDCTRKEDFSRWYTQVIQKGGMIERYPVSGCYIYRPNTIAIWEAIQKWFDHEIKELGVEPCYFPMFVVPENLQKEADHIADFAPEVAWVTRGGDNELEVPLAIRPTSETIMYPAFAQWVNSKRDLPLRLNQWSNVVRWEFKNPTPFIRTREFLWQEGHTAFATKEEADTEVLQILDLYARVYEEVLAVPVIKGRKSCKERFPGGEYTTSIEAYVPHNGRAIQAGTSHALGQNFSKMFQIRYPDINNKEENGFSYAWQNSWGLSTRSIGAMIMIHGDDQGIVLPPKVALTQVVGIAIYGKSDEKNEEMNEKLDQVFFEMKKLGVKGKVDKRNDRSPGWKFNHWELNGTPIRMEFGPKDLAKNQCVLVKRYNGEKVTVSLKDAAQTCHDLLEEIQKDMLQKARQERDARITIAWNFEDFMIALNKGNMILAPWCLTTESEEWVKDETKKRGEETKKAQGEAAEKENEELNEEGESRAALTGAAKTLCIPFLQPALPPGTKCFTGNGKDALEFALWGRSY